MIEIITEQDVLARYEQAFWAWLQVSREDPVDVPKRRAALECRESWKRVLARVRAGGDPLICVMERD